MSQELHSPSSFPAPPEHLATNWPNGFPGVSSDEFKRIHSLWGQSMCDVLSEYLDRELSTIDRYDIMKHTKNVMIEYFSGSYNLNLTNEISTRYFLDLAGYIPHEVMRRIDGNREERHEIIRTLFHRLHARAHHEM